MLPNGTKLILTVVTILRKQRCDTQQQSVLNVALDTEYTKKRAVSVLLWQRAGIHPSPAYHLGATIVRERAHSGSLVIVLPDPFQLGLIPVQLFIVYNRWCQSALNESHNIGVVEHFLPLLQAVLPAEIHRVMSFPVEAIHLRVLVVFQLQRRRYCTYGVRPFA